MFNGSYLRACMKLRIVQKLDFPFLSLCDPSHGALVSHLGRVSRILSFHSQGVVSLFIFPTGLTALDFEPYGRRYTKNSGHDRNRLYSRPIHCPASMEMHYVQWFLLKSVYEITDCAKNQIFLHESGWTKAWCPGLVFGPSAKAQELVARIRGLVIQPQNSQLVHILSFHSQGVVS